MFVSIRIISVLLYLKILTMETWNVVNNSSRSPSVSSQEISLSEDDSSTEHCLTINITESECEGVSEILKDKDKKDILNISEEGTDPLQSVKTEQEPVTEGEPFLERTPLVPSINNDDKSPEKTPVLGFFESLMGLKIKRSGWLLIGITAFLIFSKLS